MSSTIPSPHANSFVIDPAVMNTHTASGYGHVRKSAGQQRGFTQRKRRRGIGRGRGTRARTHTHTHTLSLSLSRSQLLVYTALASTTYAALLGSCLSTFGVEVPFGYTKENTFYNTVCYLGSCLSTFGVEVPFQYTPH
jgi:hypothetical protein